MASSVEAARLTEAHRLVQVRIAGQTVQLAARAWDLMDPYDLDRTLPTWLPRMEAIVRTMGVRSAQVSAGYYSTFRGFEVGVPLKVEPIVDVATDVVRADMVVTGPGSVRRAMRTVPIERAMEIGRAMSSRSASRLALNCGRRTISEAVVVDDECVGYARATGGAACSFCAMLAARGLSYKSRDAADFPAHDGCNCTAEPVYGSNPVLPPGSEQYRDLWDEVTVGLDGRAARNVFRRALAAR